MVSVPGLGISHREGNGNPLQYAYLENSMGLGAWWAESMGSLRVGHDWVTCTKHFWTSSLNNCEIINYVL